MSSILFEKQPSSNVKRSREEGNSTFTCIILIAKAMRKHKVLMIQCCEG